METLVDITPGQQAYEEYLQEQWQVIQTELIGEQAINFRNQLEDLNITEVGLLTGHPDDDANHGNVIEGTHTISATTDTEVDARLDQEPKQDSLADLETAQDTNVRFHEYILSMGRESKKNYRKNTDPKFNIPGGDRQYEAIYGAEKLGIDLNSFVVDDEQDGNVWERRKEIVPKICEWIRANNINLLLVLGTNDHQDHIATKHLGMLVSAHLYKSEEKYELDIAEVVDDDSGNLIAPSTQGSKERIINSLKEHESQFRIGTPGKHPEWDAVTETTAIHPKDNTEIETYPFFRDAYYRYYPAGSKAVMAALELAA